VLEWFYDIFTGAVRGAVAVVLLLKRTFLSLLLAMDKHSEHKNLCGSDRRSIIPYITPAGTVGHVKASELPSQGGRASSRGTCGSARAHINKEAMSETAGHVAAPELTSARRRGPGPRDTW
jgi:hypothetical protein